MLNERMPRINDSHFSMVPRDDIPRSTFVTTHTHKTTFNTGLLIPIHVDEVLPGDVHQGHVTIFARLATPLFPIMDQLTLETFFFFVPNRILWTNWVKMMGERKSPGDSISFTVPQITSPANGFPATTAGAGNFNSIYDYMGVPVVGQIPGGNTIDINALPLRAYSKIYNEWFRDQDLASPMQENTGDGPDADNNYFIAPSFKKHDYFTSARPWPLKGGQDVLLPLGGQAPVRGIGLYTTAASGSASASLRETNNIGGAFSYPFFINANTATAFAIKTSQAAAGADPQIFADLSASTGATINALRLAVQTQRLLERDARSGTRYTELLRAHFGVTPEDARLQRPEYIGGGSSPIQTQAIPQTSATGLTGGSSPLGALGAAGTVSDQHQFSYHATEHGYIIGIARVMGEVTYQQGLHRMWTRKTRYDFYWPVFAHLGEQAIRNDEIYCVGQPTFIGQDQQTFGYQERWAEYRYRTSKVTGLFRSTSAGTIDPWHLAQKFTALPTLNITFAVDNTPTSRVLAAGANAGGLQILFDSLWRIKSTRPMPMYSVPGMMDRF